MITWGRCRYPHCTLPSDSLSLKWTMNRAKLFCVPNGQLDMQHQTAPKCMFHKKKPRQKLWQVLTAHVFLFTFWEITTFPLLLLHLCICEDTFEQWGRERVKTFALYGVLSVMAKAGLSSGSYITHTHLTGLLAPDRLHGNLCGGSPLV